MNIFDKLEIKTTDWVSCIGDDYDQVVWVAGPKCTRDQWEAAKTALVAEYDAQAYARSRKEEYPPLADQLDHIYHNGVASWKANVVKPVKDKYPKP